jgi:hypothetical protein
VLIGCALAVLAILLIEFYAMDWIYLQLTKVPVQVQLNFDPSDVFERPLSRMALDHSRDTLDNQLRMSAARSS